MSFRRDGKFDYIIYHRGCLDGFSGFFVAHNSGKLDRNVEIYADVPQTKRIPPNIENKHLIIIDVAYKKELLREIFKLAASVVFIDHHISIRDDVQDLLKEKLGRNIKIIYDENRCGATLAWKFFNGRQKIPLFLKYVEDQDTGRWQYPRTKPFIYALHAYFHLSTENKSLNKWFRLLNKESVHNMIKRGVIISKYVKHLVGVNVRYHTRERFPSQKVFDEFRDSFDKPGQYVITVFNGACPSITDLAMESMERIECDFVIVWNYNSDRKEYVLSMRSKKVDVGKICRLFGGGGHTLAAACSFSDSKYKIEDMFHGNSLPRTNRIKR